VVEQTGIMERDSAQKHGPTPSRLQGPNMSDGTAPGRLCRQAAKNGCFGSPCSRGAGVDSPMLGDGLRGFLVPRNPTPRDSGHCSSP
jgi:hypothetical protein